MYLVNISALRCGQVWACGCSVTTSWCLKYLEMYLLLQVKVYCIYIYCILALRYPIGSMYTLYGIIYHQYTPDVSIYILPAPWILWVQKGFHLEIFLGASDGHNVSVVSSHVFSIPFCQVDMDESPGPVLRFTFPCLEVSWNGGSPKSSINGF